MYHYDAIPYTPQPFAQTHPQQLAILGRLFGIASTDPGRCRVLELGAATGGNLIPMAWYYPQCEFVGIELEPSQVAAGQALIEELGLTNIRFLQGDILTVDVLALGKFDYIIAHGVFSWIPENVRDAMLRLYKQCLQPNGIGYISYNASPGWHARGMVREMLLYHIRDIKDPVAQLNAALEFIDLMVDTLTSQESSLARYLLEEFHYLQHANHSYVFHEFLEPYNHSYLFSDFIYLLEQNGLNFVCESQLASMFAQRYGDRAEAFADTVDDGVRRETYLDFFNQRTLRESLICHAELQPDYAIDLDLLQQISVVSQLAPPQHLETGKAKAQLFTLPGGRKYSVTDPVAKLMLKRLYHAYPNALPCASLFQEIIDNSTIRYEQGDEWQHEIFSLFVSGALQLVASPTSLESAIKSRPQAHALARAQARDKHPITGYWHDVIDGDSFTLALIQRLDNMSDIEHLVDSMTQELADGKLCLPGLNIKTINPAKLRVQVENNIQRLLQLFCRQGLLL